jgi:hypothetical protein
MQMYVWENSLKGRLKNVTSSSWEKQEEQETVLQVEATILSPSRTKIEQKQEN